jgi:hypothetical protein
LKHHIIFSKLIGNHKNKIRESQISNLGSKIIFSLLILNRSNTHYDLQPPLFVSILF